MRKGIDGLYALARRVTDLDPLGGHLFVFLSRRRNAVKVLLFDQGGFVLLYTPRPRRPSSTTERNTAQVLRRTCWSASASTRFRCTGWRRSSRGPACRSPIARWASC
jgi:transposase